MSIQPRKQRKALYTAPLHIRRKLMSANLSKDLRADIGNYNVIRGREFQFTLQRNFVGFLSLQAQSTDKNQVSGKAQPSRGILM